MRLLQLTKKVGIWLFIFFAIIPYVFSFASTALAATEQEATAAINKFTRDNIVVIERQPGGQEAANVYSATGRDPSNSQQANLTIGGTTYWFSGWAGQAFLPSSTDKAVFTIASQRDGGSANIDPILVGSEYVGTYVTLPNGRRVLSDASIETDEGYESTVSYPGVKRAASVDPDFVGPPTPSDAAVLASGGAGGESSTASGFGCRVFIPGTGTIIDAVDTDGLLRCFVWLVYNFIAWPISVLLGIAAKMFNFIFAKSLGLVGGQVSTAMFATQFVKDAWIAIRDLINITFIFALLQVAIYLIVGKSGGYQDRLKNIIIAAVFINFSYFLVTEVIKLFNSLTVAIYQQIAAGGNLADAFTAVTGISSFDTVSAELAGNVSDKPAQLIFYLLFSSALMIIFIVVMMFSAVLFLVRYVALVLCVVFSPVLFLGLIWPGAASKSKELENTIKGQLLFPIIYLLLIWISINFISITKSSSNISAIGQNIDKLTVFAEDMQALVFNFGVSTALMIASLVLAKKYSTLGSSYISSAQKWTGSAIGATVFSPAASIGRASVGRVGGRVIQSTGASLQRLGTSKDSGWVSKTAGAIGGRALGRGLQLSGDKIQSSSFDVRGARVYQAVGGSAGMQAIYGKAKEGGYAKDQSQRAEKLKEKRDALKAITRGEASALDAAQVNKKKKDEAAEKAFKEKHNESADKVKEREERIRGKQKEWVAKQNNTKSAIKTQTSQMVEARKLKVEALEARKSDLLKAGPPTPAAASELTDIASKLAALEWKKNKKGKEQVGHLAGDSSTLKNLKLDSFAEQNEAIKTMQVEAEKASRIASLLGQKAYKEAEKIRKLEKEKQGYEDELKATEKSIKNAGKGRASAFDASISSNVNPFNISNSLVNSNARQQYFAKIREEAANSSKGGRKGKR